MWAFLAGLFAGASIGFVVAAVVAAGVREDEAIERAIAEWTRELDL